MIGKICSVFKGESFDACYATTREQLLGRYWEAMRQEARNRIRDLENRRAIQDPEYFEKLIEALVQRAQPPDPASDGHFGKEDVKLVKMLIGGMKLKGDIGKKVTKNA